jgi:hypothetical protein
MKLVNVETKEQLKELTMAWAMTWEGLREEDFELAMEECCKEGKDGTGYLIKGRVMNSICGLTGDNAYPDDLNIFAIKDFKGLAINYGARWLWDIVANNGHREGYLPFDLD